MTYAGVAEVAISDLIEEEQEVSNGA